MSLVESWMRDISNFDSRGDIEPSLDIDSVEVQEAMNPGRR